MKYLLLILVIIISGCVIFNGRLAGEDEILEGSAKGYRGLITVQVRMNGVFITDITIIDSMEDRFVGEAAMEELIDLVIMYNTTDIDVISGATESSRGFLNAVENAIINK